MTRLRRHFHYLDKMPKLTKNDIQRLCLKISSQSLAAFVFLIIASRQIWAAPNGNGVATSDRLLGWDPSPATNVAGYFFYHGEQSGSYSARVDVGTNTTYTLNGSN